MFRLHFYRQLSLDSEEDTIVAYLKQLEICLLFIARQMVDLISNPLFSYCKVAILEKDFTNDLLGNNITLHLQITHDDFYSDLYVD